MRVASALAISLPFVGLVIAVVLLWGTAFNWVYLALLLGGYLVTGFGITVGYHRLFTHKSFETSPVVKAALGIMGSMAVEGPILRWCAMHRCHHQHSDTHKDPHSPNTHGEGLAGLFQGFLHAHCGWLFAADPKGIDRYVADLQRDNTVRWVSDLFFVWVALGLAIPAAIGGLVTMSWTGALLGFLWGGAVRVFMVHHITWSINSACHLWGTRPFESKDDSRNNAFFGVIGLGEGWHNNHHAFPGSARHGLRWWEVDTSYWVIRAMELVGLARNVRTVEPERMAARARHH
jgi:stearoyl-CoA desaturase (delta-9 desaturase)